MIWISKAAGLVAVVIFGACAGLTAATGGSARLLPGCAGMELVQDASPKEDSPKVDPDTTPDDGTSVQPEAPGDNDSNDDGAGSDQASPPDAVPGCIFRKGPLDLIV
ncbi:MAG: hypothetical protein JSR89_07055 [Proteobacteria bacterium]|nr:hypothetical protein [Pseudomonadota bacterium]